MFKTSLVIFLVSIFSLKSIAKDPIREPSPEERLPLSILLTILSTNWLEFDEYSTGNGFTYYTSEKKSKDEMTKTYKKKNRLLSKEITKIGYNYFEMVLIYHFHSLEEYKSYRDEFQMGNWKFVTHDSKENFTTNASGFKFESGPYTAVIGSANNARGPSYFLVLRTYHQY